MFYIDTVVKSALVRASVMLKKMIFISSFASMSMSHTSSIMHNIFVPFIRARENFCCSIADWFPQAFHPPLPPPKRHFASSSPAKSTVVVDARVAAVVGIDITAIC
jgi:hypothetical protein